MIESESRRLVDIHLSEPTKEYDDRDFVPLVEAIHEFAGEQITTPDSFEQDDSMEIIYEKSKTILL